MTKKKETIIKFSILVITSLLVIAIYAIYNYSTKNYNYLKINKSKHLVYTKSKKQYDYYYQYKPFLNIKGEVGTVINNDIEEYMNLYNKNNIGIKYQYNVSGNILSLGLIVEDHSYAESATVFYFRSYNINLKTLEILSNDTILNYYNLNDVYIEQLLDQKQEEYYNELVEKEIINSKECNYSCFKKRYRFTDGLEDVFYYINDSKLEAYKPYVYYSKEQEDYIIYSFKLTN